MQVGYAVTKIKMWKTAIELAISLRDYALK